MKAVKLILALVVCLLLQSCLHVQEFTSHFDIALGDEYKPNIKLLSKEPPERVLVIPVFQQIPPSYTSILLQRFRDSSTVFNLVWLDKKTFSKLPSRAEVEQLASDYNCASVLYIHIRQPSAYYPIRVTVDVAMERLRDSLTLLKGSGDYDSRNEEVASSARRYSQHVLRRQDNPDKSLAILRTNPDFFEFCGWHIAKFINYIVAPPIKDLNKELDDPKNIQDFEPSDTPDAPKPVKKAIPVYKIPTEPSVNTNTPKAVPLSNPKDKKATQDEVVNQTEKTTYEEIKKAEPLPPEPTQKFEEPPPSLQNKAKNPLRENRIEPE